MFLVLTRPHSAIKRAVHSFHHRQHRYSALREIATGYAFVVLGATGMLVLFAGLLPPGPWWMDMAVHVGALLMMAFGGVLLWRMPPMTAGWLRATHHFTLAVFLQLYMVPFILWWRTLPHIGFFTANALIAVAGVAWLLVQLCEISYETGRVLGERTLQVEGRVAAVLCPLLLLVPPVYGVMHGLHFYMNAGLPPVLDATRLILVWPPWIRIAMLLSPILALAVAVEARLRCLAAIRLLGEPPSTPRSDFVP